MDATHVVVFNRLSGLALDDKNYSVTVADAATSNGALIVQNDVSGNTSQEWQVIPVPGGYSKFQNMNGGRLPDMTGGYLYSGALLQQWDYLGGLKQQWQLVPIGP